MSLKSFWNKAKGLFGKVWGGIKTGWSKAKDFIKNKITPIYEAVKPAINAVIPGAKLVTGVVDKVLPTVNGLSGDAGTALKQGLNMIKK